MQTLMLPTFFMLCFAAGAAQQPATCAAGGDCGDADDGLDAQSLLQTGTSAGNDLCPSDVQAEAEVFWKEFFKTTCKVDWDDDVPKSFKTDIDASSVFHPEAKDGAASKGCRIVTSLSEAGGAISFDVSAPDKDAAIGENWVGDHSSAVRQVNDWKVVETTGKAVCEIFGDGVSRMVDIPAGKVTEAFEQVKADFATVCPGNLVLATDLSTITVVGKTSMPDADSNSMYTFEISVDAEGKPDETIQVVVEADPVDTSADASARATNKAFQHAVLRKAEKEDSNSHHDTGDNGLIEYGDLSEEAEDAEDTASYIQNKLRVHAANPLNADATKDPEKLIEDQDFEDSEFENLLDHGQAPTHIMQVLGKVRVLNDRTSPLLCCLCGKCPLLDNGESPCDEGSEGLRTAKFLNQEEEDQHKLLEQEKLYPHYAEDLLLEVGTATAGSKEELSAPIIPGDVAMQSDLRTRSEPEYGDNFHSLVLPQRTEEDHKKVWSESRALIETAKAEGIVVPSEYHYYDNPDTKNCYRPAYNQGKCGSCWAFAALGALEKQICLRAQGDVRPSLSREMLVRCSEQNGGCQGGNADKAYEDLMEIGGVFSTDCLPYQGKGSKHCPVFAYSWFGQGAAGKTGKFARIDQEIQKSCDDHTRYSNRPPQGPEWDMPFRSMYEGRFGSLPDMNDKRLTRFRKNFAKTRARDRVPSFWLYGQEAMKTAITKYGSVYASFKVRTDFKKRACKDGCWPPGTVYGEEPTNFKPATCGCGKGHAVHIIGWGEDVWETGRKIPYWLIENSWGAAKHGDMFGEDINGVKGFGKDPFTDNHPLGIENKCMLGGWIYSALPRGGGCGGADKVIIRKDVKLSSKPDGMHFSVLIDGVGQANWSVGPDKQLQIAHPLNVAPGPHNVTLQIYAKNHPKQQSFDLETYGMKAFALRCRGRGFRYSFSLNDTKARLSWGRKTRAELKAEADALIPMNSDPKYLYGSCSEPCRTGRYSWVKPCLGLLTQWGSCYTDSWAMKSTYMLSKKRAMCTSCGEMEKKVSQKAYAVKNLPNATYLKWFKLVEQAWDAPDTPGWMRFNTGSCDVKTGGYSKNAILSATYSMYIPDNKFCDERHSAPFAKGKFVAAPGHMANGAKAAQRCPPPMLGNVNLECRAGVLYALSNTCSLRPGMPPSAGVSTGYYKTVRGVNYHGIETGAAFAVAEMNRFANRCPTLSWTRWSECNVSVPCAVGGQTRSRNPISLAKTDPKCVDMMFFEERSCVGPGFCPQVLTRFAAGGGSSIAGFMAGYKKASNSIVSGSFASAGVTMLSTASPTCENAKYWCRMITGVEKCDMYMEGHFTVRKDAEYYLHYEIEGGGLGSLEFNTLGEGSETKPQFYVAGGATSTMYEWQDLGFHHRRRRSASKPWERITSMKMKAGTYYAKMTLANWQCPVYKLRLEQLSAVYRSPLLLGARKSAASLTKGANGGSRQKTVTWWNDWGAVSSWYLNYRGRHGSSYAPKNEVGSVNELVLRDEAGGKVIKRVPITKFNFTADELYTLCGLDKYNLPATIGKWRSYELVIRNTVILPEKGDYVFKFQIDTSYKAANQAWHMESRRRNTKFRTRVGTNPSTGRDYTQATFSSWQGSATKEVSFRANDAGTVPFEASIIPSRNAPGDKIVLPNFVMMEVKRKDMLHGESLTIGTSTKYLSDLVAIRGDQSVRIDWPERDDPLSSELKTQTFQALDPQELLIGNQEVEGFQATAEAKIDAGACTSVEAWAQGVNKASRDQKDFWGVGLNLCDVDGNNQFLELVTYHPPSALTANMSKNSKVRIGWVHIGFTQPTHMRIMRDPLDPGKFAFGYRPDDRESFATPFDDLASGFTGKMDVGVSMTSVEAYRYAEFYNITIEACPHSCNDASGKQVLCGDITTACGNKLKCGSSCAGGGVCKADTCMACPALTLTAEQSSWGCGTVIHTCTNPQGQKIQVVRDVGKQAQPTQLHFCKNHSWHCVGQSKWAYLSEGKECGTVKDNCNADVKLFDCAMTNDVCEAHKCKCTPTVFDPKYNCGSEANGCGQSVAFGSNGDKCPGATDVCNFHKCCTPKTKADFPAGYQCGSAADGCGGFVDFNQAPASPFFKKKGTSRRRFMSYYSGQRGVEIIAATDATVTQLARGLMEGAHNLSETSRVSLWDVAGKKEIAHVDVGPSAKCKDGYCWAAISPVKIKKSQNYRIVQKIWRNMKDKYTGAYLYGSSLSASFESKFGQFKGLVAVNNEKGFPDDTYINGGQGMGIVNFDVLENDGCGAGQWTCHKNHSCTKPPASKNFIVESGPCKLDGNCVTSSTFGKGNYPNNEKCTIKTPGAGTLKVTDYRIENGYDYLTIDGKGYRSSTPPATVITASKGITVTWKSDGSVTNKGFKMCVVDSLLLEEDAASDESEADESYEADESQLAELSDEEQDHARSKYQQKREENEAEVAAAAEVDKQNEEAETLSEAAALLESEAQEIEGTALDEDELALPDLTAEAP